MSDEGWPVRRSWPVESLPTKPLVVEDWRLALLHRALYEWEYTITASIDEQSGRVLVATRPDRVIVGGTIDELLLKMLSEETP